jgi:hypothetical protein
MFIQDPVRFIAIANDLCICLLVTPSGHAVTLQTSRRIITQVLLMNLIPSHKRMYRIARVLGWVGFGVHIICLGMSSLANQILTVVVLLVSTIIIACNIGVYYQHIVSKLKIE